MHHLWPTRAGKTTALKHLCQRFFDDTTFLQNYEILIRIHLRDLNLVQHTAAPEYIRRTFQEMLRLRISYPDDLAGEDHIGDRRAIRDSVVTDWLNAVHALVILDGFDEITLKSRRDLGEVVWLLTRRKTSQGRLGRADLGVLPNELYVRESLLAGAERMGQVEDLRQRQTSDEPSETRLRELELHKSS